MMEAVANHKTMPRYTAYKDSGVEWLGEIPEHWEVKRGKWLFVKQERPVRQNDEIVTCFRDGQVTLRSNRKTEGFTNALKEHGYQGIRKGDLVIHAMDAFAGAIGVSDSDGKSTPVYAACTPRKEHTVNPYFYAYLLRNLAKNGFIQSLAKGIRERSTDFRYADFSDLELSLPSLTEQTAIADFLNRKTAQIDNAIAQKERMIQLLKERRQILIHRAVTRGLDPDVKMKDSGVEWIGEIPEHWEIEKLKFHFSLLSGGTPSKDRTDFWNGDIPWVSPKDMKSDWISKTDDSITAAGLEQMNGKLLPKDTLLMVVRSGILQRKIPVAISKVELAINQDMKAFVRSGRIDSIFLFYFINGCERYLRNEWVKQVATVESIEVPIMNNTPILIPPANEQIEIVKHIQEIEAKVVRALRSKYLGIEKLKEYKSTLINAGVTGKIKVY